jgi:Zn-dependent peptidase ImmA (M78 family)
MLRRGFKTEAERIAAEARRLVGVSDRSPLPARALAKRLGVVVVGPLDIPDLPEDLASQMLVQHASRWSAFTFKTGDRDFIVHNTTHEPPRQESDLMHELAHIWCKHKPGRIEPAGRLPWAYRTFDEVQEEEAAWLGGCLQIPREALLWFVRRRFDNSAIAAHFNASEEMARFRRNITAVDAQLSRAADFGRSKYRRRN